METLTTPQQEKLFTPIDTSIEPKQGVLFEAIESDTLRPIRPFGEDDEHVISASQFDPDRLPILFVQADVLREQHLDRKGGGRRELAQRHIGGLLCVLFYEPSTRTRLSFETAALAMGFGEPATENAREFSSAAKGETIEDTIRNLDEYNYDAIVIRHHEQGSLERAARVGKTPILNAGDGKGEHPTQALLDAYTIQREKGRLTDLKIVMGGDLRFGRTVRSLAQLMSKYAGNEITFASLPDLAIGEDIKDILKRDGTTYHETDQVIDALDGADIVYWTRTQKERLDGDLDLSKADEFILNRRTIQKLSTDARIMHPLPRVDEIDPEIDDDPRAIYFKQAGNGLYVRMALLDNILNAKS